MNLFWISFLLLSLVGGFFLAVRKSKRIKSGFLPKAWKRILAEEIAFYAKLEKEDRKLFERKVASFLRSTKISAAETVLEDIDRLLVAAGAVIPIFRLKGWRYPDLNEVVVYGESFNRRFAAAQDGSKVDGLLGTGAMEGKMFLSQTALRKGFAQELDGNNAAIHEFVHLIDKLDGSVDGVPASLMPRQYVLPWLNLVGTKMSEMKEGRSDLNAYGATNQGEFLAVASEYFFEDPAKMKRRHPELHETLKRIFRQKQ